MFISKKALKLTEFLESDKPESQKLKEYLSQLESIVLEVIQNEDAARFDLYTYSKEYRKIMELPTDGEIISPLEYGKLIQNT